VRQFIAALYRRGWPRLFSYALLPGAMLHGRRGNQEKKLVSVHADGEW
jgi:hypothetical protein